MRRKKKALAIKGSQSRQRLAPKKPWSIWWYHPIVLDIRRILRRVIETLLIAIFSIALFYFGNQF